MVLLTAAHPVDMAVIVALCDQVEERMDARDRNLAVRIANEVWSSVK